MKPNSSGLHSLGVVVRRLTDAVETLLRRLGLGGSGGDHLLLLALGPGRGFHLLHIHVRTRTTGNDATVLPLPGRQLPLGLDRFREFNL